MQLEKAALLQPSADTKKLHLPLLFCINLSSDVRMSAYNENNPNYEEAYNLNLFNPVKWCSILEGKQLNKLFDARCSMHIAHRR